MIRPEDIFRVGDIAELPGIPGDEGSGTKLSIEERGGTTLFS